MEDKYILAMFFVGGVGYGINRYLIRINKNYLAYLVETGTYISISGIIAKIFYDMAEMCLKI